jgi:colanic acid biosynthesis glycosyl transferase WcaI
LRILAIYRHYWPDATPYARLLKAILESQATNGHDVVSFCAQPSYNDLKIKSQPWSEVLNGVKVKRVRLLPERKRWHLIRIVNSIYFLIRGVWHAIFNKYNLIVSNTHPAILVGVALRIIKRVVGTPYILHCQDIHPESAVLAGKLKPGWLSRWLQNIDAKNCRQALYVVTLSEDMKQTLQSRDPELSGRVIVLNNFAVPVEANDCVADWSDRESFRVIFAGNLGQYQGLDRLVDAVNLLGDSVPVELVFMGAGAETSRLKQLAKNATSGCIRFVAFQSNETAYRWIETAHLGIVSLSPGICSVAYPSKTMSYLAAGCPVLAIVEQNTQLAAEVEGYNYGYVPAGTMPIDIAAALKNAWYDREQWTAQARRELALRSERQFGAQQALKAWDAIFDSVSSTVGNRHAPLPHSLMERRVA